MTQPAMRSSPQPRPGSPSRRQPSGRPRGRRRAGRGQRAGRTRSASAWGSGERDSTRRPPGLRHAARPPFRTCCPAAQFTQPKCDGSPPFTSDPYRARDGGSSAIRNAWAEAVAGPIGMQREAGGDGGIVTTGYGTVSASARPAAWPAYEPGVGYDELVGEAGTAWPVAQGLWRHVVELGADALADRQRAADREISTLGVTFGTREGEDSVDRPWPFDVIPRVLAASEWDRIHDGLVQRLRALNRFIDDVYHDQRAVQEGVVPGERAARLTQLPTGVRGGGPPGGHLGAHLRERPGTRRGRHVLRPRGQPAGALGRVVSAREPDGGEARVPRAVPPLQHRAGRPLREPPGRAAVVGGAGGRRSHDRPAHPGRAQRRVLRARLSRPAAGRRARRRTRPGGARRRHACTCGPSTDSSASTSSTDESTTSTSTPRCSAATRWSACPG